MRKLNMMWTMVRSVFIKGIVQWRLLMAFGTALILIHRSMGFVAADMEMYGVQNIHWLEMAATLYANTDITSLVVLAILVWMSDAPFFNQSEVFVVQRTGRWPWMITRLLYAIGGSGLFLLMEGIFITLWGLPHAGAEQLSPMFYSRCIFYDPTMVMPPAYAAGVGFLLNWMSVSIFVLLMFAINMRRSRGVGLAVTALYWGFDLIFQFTMIKSDLKWLMFSPTFSKSLTSVVTKFANAGGGPTLTEAVLVMGGMLLILLTVILLLTPGYPFPFVKSREGKITD